MLGRWTLVEFRKTGGNGDVWLAEGADPPLVAIKVLHRTAATDYARFRREVAICEELGPDAGLLPVVASHLPETPSRKDRPWLAMPLATDLTTALTRTTLDTKVAAVRDVAEILARVLSEHGLHHRDVKPANLFRFQDRIAVGDLGLAKRPTDEDLTEEGHVGPFMHLPTEVVVGDVEPDWERVDVYCLANTLWCIAVERLHPPKGQIRADEDDSLALILGGEPYIGQLAGLIEGATARSPSSRPTLEAFAVQLADWLTLRRSRGEDFARDFESSEARKLAVLRWLVREVRTEPVFDQLMYQIPELEAPSPDVDGLTEGDVSDALLELIEDGLVEGEPRHTLGRRAPRYFTRLYPTLYGIEALESVEAITAQAIPLLRKLVQGFDFLTLPKTAEPFELAEGLSLSPPEAYFQLRVLEAQGLLRFRILQETGGHKMLGDVKTTTEGKRFLSRVS